MKKLKVAIIGSGNIGTDLMIKILRNAKHLEMAVMVGIDPASDGLARAQRMGVATTHEGVEGLTRMDVFQHIDFVFDATSAGAHVQNDAFLRTIGGVENHIKIQVGGHEIAARAEGDTERTRASDNKASAVHFFHFDFTPEAIAAWKSGEGSALFVIDHPNYGHAALISPDARAFLSRECF